MPPKNKKGKSKYNNDDDDYEDPLQKMKQLAADEEELSSQPAKNKKEKKKGKIDHFDEDENIGMVKDIKMSSQSKVNKKGSKGLTKTDDEDARNRIPTLCTGPRFVVFRDIESTVWIGLIFRGGSFELLISTSVEIGFD
jgi:hypothetical protein